MSAQEEDLIISELTRLISCLSRADIHAFYENRKLKTTTKIIYFCHLLKLFLKPSPQTVYIKIRLLLWEQSDLSTRFAPILMLTINIHFLMSFCCQGLNNNIGCEMRFPTMW